MCCGSRRQQLRTVFQPSVSADPPTVATGPTAAQQSSKFFVYEGLAAFTAIGRVTGKRYQFARAGARVAVDPRDAAGLRGRPVARRS
jgi:hypothetical protein